MITDEVYEHIVFRPHRHRYLASLPGMFERTISCSSLSKTYSITGWRLGYAIGAARRDRRHAQGARFPHRWRRRAPPRGGGHCPSLPRLLLRGPSRAVLGQAGNFPRLSRARGLRPMSGPRAPITRWSTSRLRGLERLGLLRLAGPRGRRRGCAGLEFLPGRDPPTSSASISPSGMRHCARPGERLCSLGSIWESSLSAGKAPIGE